MVKGALAQDQDEERIGAMGGVDPDGPVLGDSELAPDNGQVNVCTLMGIGLCLGIEVALGDLLDIGADLFRRKEDLGAGDMPPGGFQVGNKEAFSAHCLDDRLE